MNGNMFGIDLYPTPKEVIELMLRNVIVSNKVILEPSAGTGNIVDYCYEYGAKEVIACEIDSRLRRILSPKCHIVEDDFMNLTPEKVSHVDLIVMNPPFSSQEKHVLHAWDIAPAGCQIISLCNNSMLDNRYSRTRTQIMELVNAYGSSQAFGSCFDTAERQTNVEIGCVWLHKPGTGENEFEGYFDLSEDERRDINGSGIVRYDFVQDIVSRYVESVSMFDEVDAANNRINAAISGVVSGFNIRFGANKTGRDNEYKQIDRQTFKKELQKAAWNKLFDLFKMDKYVTRGVMADINKFVEQQTHVPFTVKNVYLMIRMIVGTHGSRMDKVLVEAFEKICSFSKDNSGAGEGWRTNTDFTINKKFILPYMTRIGWSGELQLSYSSSDKMDDIVKALCFLTAINYDQVKRFDSFISDFNNAVKHPMNKMQFGQWYEWSFFRFKGYKKGTMHFEFIDEDIWLRFNQKVAEIKGWKNILTHSKKARRQTTRKTT
jgi:predicted RNA methylase